MKLLEDVPSAVAHRPPPRRTMVTLAVMAAFLLVAAIAGIFLIATSGDGSDQSAAGADLPRPQGTLVDWAAGVTDACTTVAAEHPVMAQGPEARVAAANLAAVDAGTHALVGAVRELPLPVDEAEQEQAGTVVAAGDQADQTWNALAATPDQVTETQLTEAAALTAAFVAGATELGASCAPIG